MSGKCFGSQNFLVVVYQTDLSLISSHPYTHTHRTSFFPDGSNQHIAFSCNFISATASRQKEAVSFFVIQLFSFAGNRSFPVQKKKADKRSIRHISFHPPHHNPIQIKLIYRKIITICHMGITAFALKNRYPVCHCQSLLNVQIPLSPVLSHPPIVVNPVGDIGILLNLRNENVFSNGVNRTRFNEKHISFLNRHCMKYLQKGI